jgi:GNAT superfamily N-acetyltransferase
MPPYKLQLAVMGDVDCISQLIQLSARSLGAAYYQENTIESALKGAFGVDSQLIKDQTYYVILNDDLMIACGGWSFRKTLFGSDTNNIRDPEKLNPITDAAKIRAFFVHPNYARQGLGKMLIDKCEAEAITFGFTQAQLMSTLSGVNFYKKNGYHGTKHIFHNMNDGNKIQFLPMTKNLNPL